jgi:UDP-N-acetylglucosamine acyltransferase
MIHQTAIVDARVRLGDRVRIGAFAVVEGDVEIGAGTVIGCHAVILGPTRIGEDNVIHAHTCLGDSPQDLDYRGEPTCLEIGARNIIREFVTMHRGSGKDRGRTRVGDDGLFMAYSHVAHDCEVGHGVVMANGANLGGHVQVGDRVNIGGLVAVHQFVRIGCHAMLGGGSIVVQDVPPYMTAVGNRARLYGLNRRGLQRAGFTPAVLDALKRAYRLLYRSGWSFDQARSALLEAGPTPEVAYLLDFLQACRRGVMR